MFGNLFKKNYGELHCTIYNLPFLTYLKKNGNAEKTFLSQEITKLFVRIIDGNIWNYYSNGNFFISPPPFKISEVIIKQNVADNSIFISYESNELKTELFKIPFEKYYQLIQKGKQPLPIFGQNKYVEEFEQFRKQLLKLGSDFAILDDTNSISIGGIIHFTYLPILAY